MDRAFEDLVKRSILTLRDRKPAARWIGDRTPRGLRVFVEHAPYFLILRDGRDVLVSWTYHVLRMRPHVRDAVVPPECRAQFDPLYERFQADPAYFTTRPHELLSAESWVRAIAGRWANWIQADNASLEAIRAGKKGCQARVMVLRYEELHAQTELWRRRMYEFLGLDPDEALPISAETRTTAGFDREDPTSFWRHGTPGDWRRHRTDDFARWFNDAAGQTLVDLGYETSARW
ncbi:sulfotransferase domain-containing protein [Leptolyngbya sp. 15MV]|nr:sulfotransferase domain-containing protein [Leptolyngbya sp. 15MV]